MALIVWFMSFLIGIYVAVIAVSVTLFIKYLTMLKLSAVKARILDVSTRCPVSRAELRASITVEDVRPGRRGIRNLYWGTLKAKFHYAS